MIQAIESILDSENGTIKWNASKEVRAFCHGFLFHYEQLILNNTNITPGSLLCKHDDECPYRLTHHLLYLYNVDKVEGLPAEWEEWGCSFRHLPQSTSFLLSIMEKYDKNEFFSKLHSIYLDHQDKRITREFYTKERGTLILPLFNDTIFAAPRLSDTPPTIDDFPKIDDVYAKLANMLE